MQSQCVTLIIIKNRLDLNLWRTRPKFHSYNIRKIWPTEDKFGHIHRFTHEFFRLILCPSDELHGHKLRIHRSDDYRKFQHTGVGDAFIDDIGISVVVQKHHISGCAIGRDWGILRGIFIGPRIVLERSQEIGVC